MLILSSDELEILEYLKSWKGQSVSMLEICRCAGGRKKFREAPNWAKCMMGRLVDAKLVEVNDRGHYRFMKEASVATPKAPAPSPEPVEQEARVVGDDYFPSSGQSDSGEEDTKWWISPQIQEILKHSKKKRGAG
jgi:hypothetical protein